MRRIYLTIATVILASLACGLPGASSTPTPSPDELATIVASTMQAISANGASTNSHETPPATSEPAATPVNLQVAYVKNSNVWRWTDNSGPVQLTSDGLDSGVRLSDDGQVAIFIRNDELWAVDINGIGARALVPRAFIDAFPLPEGGLRGKINRYAFVPGSHQVYFDFLFETESYPIYQDDLWRVDADDPSPIPLLDAGRGGDWYFSPDKQWVAISQPEAVAVMHLDGSDYRSATTFPLVFTYSEFFFRPIVVWMDDSSGFYLIVPNPTALENPNGPDRFLFVPLTGSPALLAEFNATIGISSSAVLAPSGILAGYVILKGEVFELHIIDTSTADKVVITSREQIALINWAPDAKHFVFWQGNETFLGGLDGSAQRLEVIPHYSYMQWVDANRFLFTNGDELRLGSAGSTSLLIAMPVINGDFDFTK